MEYKLIQVDLKADAGGSISGYGSVFNVEDDGGDIVSPGAFGGSLASGRVVKMLREHNPNNVIGVWDDIAEDETGLRVSGRIATKTQLGAETYELIKMGGLNGLSIGYRVTNADRGQSGVRVIKSAELWEVSVVTFPMNTAARIDAVKSDDLQQYTLRDIERLLTRDAGLSRSVAGAVVRRIEALKSMRDAENSEAEKLSAALRSLASNL